ncbi:hypothetical protein BpHYR1_010114 [Brachionus plicatilis]|uniref:Uncharacterized protein n=1 Tax=Brachionus plicatilis TaxID=10195 RepID=A0A3M7PQE4_BRAPC|nr:hypothetical protein BpHYR1_010114 [Brachionus plicatilis]
MNTFSKNNQKLKTEEAQAILYEFDPEEHDHTCLIGYDNQTWKCLLSFSNLKKVYIEYSCLKVTSLNPSPGFKILNTEEEFYAKIATKF